MRRQKYQIKLFLLGIILLTASNGHAIERAGQIGQTWSFPVFPNPTKSYHEKTYHFESAYFLTEKISASFSLNAQIDGRKIFYLELGPDYYPFADWAFQPFISARLLYSMVPKKDAGWISNIGVECPLGKSYEIENLKLRLSTGVGQFFSDKRNDLFLELIRLGFVWVF